MDTETIEQLRAALEASTDEAERAGLLDAIAIELSLRHHPLEALHYSDDALEIRARLADRDVRAEPPFAASLFNRGGHLRALERHEDAIAPYALALKVATRHLDGSAESGERYGRYAQGLATVLAQLRCFDVAARFQGAVAHLLLDVAGDGTQANAALHALAAYLDALNHEVPARRPELSTDGALLSLAIASLAAAQWMDDVATQAHRQGQLNAAIAWATRTVRYCDLVATGNDSFATLGAANLARVGTWSAAARDDGGLACLSRLKRVVPAGVTGDDQRRVSSHDARVSLEPSSIGERRLWCISARDLVLVIADLGRAGIPPSDVHTLADCLRTSGIYPARDYSHRCQPRTPDIFITYDWRQNFSGLYDMIQGALVYMGERIRQARPELDHGRIRQLVFDELGFWIDFVFIDQSARDLSAEVRYIIPQAIDASDVHLVLSDTALLRSWCCYELALFNTRSVDPSYEHEIGRHLVRPLRSFVTQDQAHGYNGFGQTATTNPEDKDVIEKYLREDFPGGLVGVDLLLAQASMLNKRATPEFAVGAAAEQQMLAAVDRWLSR